MKWLKQIPDTFNPSELDKILKLVEELENLQRIQNPRQSVKDKVATIEQKLEATNPFVSPEAEEQFWKDIDEGKYDKEMSV